MCGVGIVTLTAMSSSSPVSTDGELEDFGGIILDLDELHDLIPVGNIARQQIRSTQNSIHNLREKLKTEPLVKLKDKISFMIGIINVFVTAYIVSGYCQYYPLFYTVKALLLISLRFMVFRSKKWHYYLFDFCYFANALTLIFIHVFPTSEILFQICFSFSVGPLLWAILAWNNSLVLHSIDYTTSVFIHLSPAVLLYTLRWKQSSGFLKFTPTPHSFVDLTLVPLIPYLVWQVSYLIITEGIWKVKIRERDLMTSFRYFTSSKTKGPIAGMIKYFTNEQARLMAFCAYQLLYTFGTMLPSVLCYNYEYVHLALIVSLALVSVWNGANFYFEVFLVKYKARLEAKKAASGKTNKQPKEEDSKKM